MRTREQILQDKECDSTVLSKDLDIVIELLLDIRDKLENLKNELT